jgi:peptidoglycan/xylan/chitin deacetylase (PgdA/CDA1 family)
MKSALKALVKPVLVSLASQWGPQARNDANSRLWVLMYHRILPSTDIRFQQEEPGMLVQPETFAMHIKELKKNFDLIKLGEWVDAKANGEPLPKKACAITFDDGWLDNFEFAFPILQAESAPATLFAVADKIGTDFQFWPNIIAMLLLNGATSKMLQHPLFQSLAASLQAIKSQPTRDTIAHIIAQLKQHSDEAIFTALADIAWRSLCPVELPPALMSWDQLKTMQTSGLVDVGSHTCSHRRLTNALPQADLEHEIIASKTMLQKKLNAPVDLFCFPNGDYNADALALVESHYKAAVTTRRGINQVDATQLHELTRIGLHDEVSHTQQLFRARLSGWV